MTSSDSSSQPIDTVAVQTRYSQYKAAWTDRMVDHAMAAACAADAADDVPALLAALEEARQPHDDRFIGVLKTDWKLIQAVLDAVKAWREWHGRMEQLGVPRAGATIRALVAAWDSYETKEGTDVHL